MAYHSNQDSFERDTGHNPGLSQSNEDVCLTLLLLFNLLFLLLSYYFFCLVIFNSFKNFLLYSCIIVLVSTAK